MKKLILFLVILFIKNLSAIELGLELVDVKNIALQSEQTGQPTVFTGEPFKLKVLIKNATDRAGDITLNGLEKLVVMGKSTHSNISVINGKFVAENSYFYDVYTNSEGAIEIGPAQVTENGNLIKSNTVKFRSIKKSPEIQAAQERRQKDENGNDFGLECELVADKQTVFQGEPLIVTLKIKSFGQIAKIGMDTIKFQDFQVKESEQLTRRQETIKNRLYEVVEKKFYLLPLKAGTFSISPAKVIYQVAIQKKRKHHGFFDDDFFSGFFNPTALEPHEAFSNSLTIQVKSAIQENVDLDGIGKFTLFTSSVDKTSVLVNEAISLKLELEGETNFEQIVAPSLQLEPYIKSYESKSEFVEDQAKGLFAGKKRFEFVIQIGRAGNITIPSQKFKYFDTVAKTVKTLETLPIKIQVSLPAGEKSITKMPTQVEEAVAENLEEPVKPEIQDINFIEQDGPISKKNHWAMPWWLLFLLLLIPTFIYFKILQRLLLLIQKNKHFKKISKKSSLSRFTKDFAIIEETNRPEQLYHFFMNLLSKKFEAHIQDLTHDKTVEKLATLNWEAAKISDFLDFLNDCASLHFITSHNKIDLKQSALLFKKGSYWTKLLTKN